jgi:hypothetical protein
LGGCATGGCATGGCAAGGCATGGCASGNCGTTTYVAPADCNSCATGSAPAITPQPSYPPSQATPGPAPSLNNNPGPTPTYKNTMNANPDLRMQPIRSNSGNSVAPVPVPQLNAPDNHTAQLPEYHAAYRLISTTAPAATTAAKKPVADMDGWRALEE